MTKVIYLLLMTTVLLTFSRAEAQQTTTIPKIGYLTGASPATMKSRIEAFQQGLRDLGYIEGKNIIVEYRYADGKMELLSGLAEELVSLKPDVIVTGGPSATRPVKKATNTIPIIMAQDSDPIGNGFVMSLARPGGNITGLSIFSPELSGKRLEILKEVVPRLARVVVLSGSDPGTQQELNQTELAAQTFNIQTQAFQIESLKDIESSFQAARKQRADAVLLLETVVASSQRKQFATMAVKNRLPVTYYRREFVEDGGLMSYGVSFPDMDRRAATFVDKILKGAKPSDLPVEQPKKFELVINLKSAKQIGLTIPPNVLARADRVIK